MRTRDGAVTIFQAAIDRELHPRKQTYTAVHDAARRALGLCDAQPKKKHPATHFLAGGVAFFHDHPMNCGSAQIAYKGPPFSRDDACDTMKNMGFERVASNPAADTYSKPGGAPIDVTMAPVSTQDRKYRDEGESPGGGIDSDETISGMQTTGDSGASGTSTPSSDPGDTTSRPYAPSAADPDTPDVQAG